MKYPRTYNPDIPIPAIMLKFTNPSVSMSLNFFIEISFLKYTIYIFSIRGSDKITTCFATPHLTLFDKKTYRARFLQPHRIQSLFLTFLITAINSTTINTSIINAIILISFPQSCLPANMLHSHNIQQRLSL